MKCCDNKTLREIFPFKTVTKDALSCTHPDSFVSSLYQFSIFMKRPALFVFRHYSINHMVLSQKFYV